MNRASLRTIAGFTLIELVVLLLVASILLVTIIGVWPSTTPMTLNAAAQTVKSDLQFAQARAFNYNQSLTITFSSTGYTISNNTGPSVFFPGTGNSQSATVGLPSGITLSTTGLTSNILDFDHSGVPWTGVWSSGPTMLTVAAQITLTRSGISQSLSVIPQTGAVLDG